jgi:hypothetical protein
MLPIVTVRNSEIPPAQMNSGCTPMLLTTHSNGMQSLSALPQLAPVSDSNCSLSAFAPLPLGPVIMNPCGNMLTSVPLPSASPIPMFLPFVPSASPQLMVPMPSMSASTMYSPTSSMERDWETSRSIERDEEETELGEIEHFESERPIESEDEEEDIPKQPSRNEKQIPVPELLESMTKKDLVHATLDWFYEVFGSDHFDCEGRRGKNVLRVKVKTRGALEHICPFINECTEEGLLYHVSCPISTKKARQHIRGYLAYIEAISEEAADRIIEVFEKYNTIQVENCDGNLEHPFKGISRNPIAVRPRGHLAA